MDFIVIDPGGTTGIAVFHNSKCTETHSAEHSDGVLEDVLFRHMYYDLVVEQGPTNRAHYAEPCRKIEQKLRHSGRRITWVLPAQWKPSPMATMARSPWVMPLTKHERDAIRIGNYYVACMESR